MRVASEILAYQEYLHRAWSWLPVSAVMELTAVTLFAINMVATFASPAPPTASPSKQKTPPFDELSETAG